MITSLAAQPAGPGAEITFTLSGEARIAAEIINLAGRPVRLLTADRPMTAGTKRLVWDGRSATGVSVPAGVYLVRVGAAAQSGQQATAVTSMALLR